VTAFFLPMKIFRSVVLKLLAALIPIGALIWGATNFDFFDYSIVELGFPSWELASYFTRFLIGIQCGLGVAILFSGNRNKKLISAYLLFAGVLLIISILQVTILPLNRVYFGYWELFKLNIWQGPLVWFITILAVFLIRKFDRENFLNCPNWLRSLIVIGGLISPFVLNYPPQWAIYGEKGITESKTNLLVDSLASYKSSYVHLMDPKELKSGKKLICFASLTCPFCLRAAYKFHVLRNRNPDAQCFMILTGNPSLLELFEQRTSCENVPRMLLNDPLFNKITGGGVPKIYLVDNGTITHRLPYWAVVDEHVE
jgi:hypothetical protein